MAQQPPWHEGFESPEVTFRPTGGDASYRVAVHQRAANDPHSGRSCEQITLEAGGGTNIYFSQDVGQALVIDELTPTVWVRSDRSGLQLFAHIVLPRTIDSRTGQPAFVLVAGTSYANVNAWQQLRIDDLPHLLTRQVRMLRAELGPKVDEREAYVERVVLNVYGGPGVTNVWIDDLDIVGYVARPAGAETQAAGPYRPAQPQPSLGTSAPLQPLGKATAANPRVELSGPSLLIDGRPTFARMIQYQGDPLSLLQRLGFNAIWLDRTPPSELLSEAASLGLWIVCPPPKPEGLDLPYGSVRPPPEIGSEFQSVLAWDLGKNLSTDELEPTRRWVEQVRAAGRKFSRPLLGHAEAELRSYSRYLDVLMLDRSPVGTSLELTAYRQWLGTRPLLARPGTPVWTNVQTQLPPAVAQQLSLADPARAVPRTIPSEQMQLMVYAAVASGYRGILFESHTPLSADDADTRQRAITLEMLNLQLALIEPWAAGGTFVATVEANTPEVMGAVLRTDRARLLLPFWITPGAQYVPGQSAANNVALVLPGIPESCSAYELAASGLRPVRHKRVTGGMQVTLDEFGLASLVLLAHDPVIISTVSQQAASVGPRITTLLRDLAVRKLHVVQQVTGELTGRVKTPPATAEWMNSARQNLQACDSHLTARDYPSAAQSAERAMRAMRLWERTIWDAAVKGLPAPVSRPGAVSLPSLPWHFKLMDRVGNAHLGPNRLPGGDLEDLDAIMAAGWQHNQHHCEGVQTTADLVRAGAHSGNLGLRIFASADDPKTSPGTIETPPVWITTPPVQVEAGELILIHAWVRVPKPIEGSVDGLVILDSISGDALGERIGHSKGWRQVSLYRLASQSGTLTVTFALSGLGEAMVDNVSIHAVESNAGIPPQQSALARPR